MKRLVLLASALSLISAALAACVSPERETPNAAAAAEPALVTVASVDPQPLDGAAPLNAPLPMAIAPAGPSAPEDALVIPIAYACQGGRAFTAAFPANGESVRIAAAGEVRVLPHKDAADTVMFSDGVVTLTAEGAEATLTGPDGSYRGCMAG
jgi:hypothetical protein